MPPELMTEVLRVMVWVLPGDKGSPQLRFRVKVSRVLASAMLPPSVAN